MRIGVIVSILIGVCGTLSAQIGYDLTTDTSVDYASLTEGFKHPPQLEAGMRSYWWWLNSMATKESITRDLEEMNAKGYGGAVIFDAGSSNYSVARRTKAGPCFLSEEWIELYQHAVSEADRLGMELSINTQSGWNPGSPEITPEMALKKLVYSETAVEGGCRVKVTLPRPESKLMYEDARVQAIPVKRKDAPVEDEAITQWGNKSFNRSMGWRGMYPLHQLRGGFDHAVDVDVIAPAEITDLTDKLDGDELVWDAPGGDWVIIRYGWTCTGARTSTTSGGWGGLSVDHLCKDAFELFRTTTIQPLIDAAQEAGDSLKFIHTDSWEMGRANWTTKFPEEFERLRGYDVYTYLPVMTGRVVESQEVSNRFLHDIRKTVGDCVLENFYIPFAELAHKHGMGVHPESGGPHSAPVDALRVLGNSDIPMGEFWARSNTHRVEDSHRLAVKQSSCAAHTTGKRFVAAEGPTSIGPQWERSPRDLKANLDRIFCVGVNRIVWHTFTSSPREFGLPGNEYFAGTHLNANVTWWEQARAFISYLNRCSYLLQQGLFVADVLYYYGDDVPNFVFLKDEYQELDKGYNWDKCSKDIIVDRVSFSNGRIMLPDGMNYRVLVLAPEHSIDLEVLSRVESLAKEGMTIVAPRPTMATGLKGYPQSDTQLKEMADRLWGSIDGKMVTRNAYGKGQVIWGEDINSVLRGMGVYPDFSYKGTNDDTALDFIHRETADHDLYFVVNRHLYNGVNDFEYRYVPDLPDRYEMVECRFRMTGKVPELWDPLTGDITEMLTYRDDGECTTIPLHFEPEGSKFVVFREKGEDDAHVVSITKDGTRLFPDNRHAVKEHPHIQVERVAGKVRSTIYEPGEYTVEWSNGQVRSLSGGCTRKALSGSWTLSFDPEWGGPDKVQAKELKSWTEFDEDGIKYYSGTAVYAKEFSLNARDIRGKRILLDLGNVLEMASITINGEELPVSWSAPFVFDITHCVKQGRNALTVEVVNMWTNRLILDGKLPEHERLAKTNIIKFRAEDADKYLRKSGLLGDVTLICADMTIL